MQIDSITSVPTARNSSDTVSTQCRRSTTSRPLSISKSATGCHRIQRSAVMHGRLMRDAMADIHTYVGKRHAGTTTSFRRHHARRLPVSCRRRRGGKWRQRQCANRYLLLRRCLVARCSTTTSKIGEESTKNIVRTQHYGPPSPDFHRVGLHALQADGPQSLNCTLHRCNHISGDAFTTDWRDPRGRVTMPLRAWTSFSRFMRRSTSVPRRRYAESVGRRCRTHLERKASSPTTATVATFDSERRMSNRGSVAPSIARTEAGPGWSCIYIYIYIYSSIRDTGRLYASGKRRSSQLQLTEGDSSTGCLPSSDQSNTIQYSWVTDVFPCRYHGYRNGFARNIIKKSKSICPRCGTRHRSARGRRVAPRRRLRVADGQRRWAGLVERRQRAGHRAP